MPVETQPSEEEQTTAIRDILDHILAGARFLHVRTSEEDAFCERFKEIVAGDSRFWSPPSEPSATTDPAKERRFVSFAAYDELTNSATRTGPGDEATWAEDREKIRQILTPAGSFAWDFKLNVPAAKRDPDFPQQPFGSPRHPFQWLSEDVRELHAAASTYRPKLEAGQKGLAAGNAVLCNFLFVRDPAMQTLFQSRAVKVLDGLFRNFDRYLFVFILVGLHDPAEFIGRDMSAWVHCFDYPLPGRDRLRGIVEEIQGCGTPGGAADGGRLADDAVGLTETQLRFALNLARVKGVTEPSAVAQLIQRHKADALRAGNAFLDYIPQKPAVDEEGLDEDVGGMANLKDWVKKRHRLVHRDTEPDAEIRALLERLDPPRGLLLFGVSGGGKSLMVKTIARYLQLPLLKLDLGRIFGQYVGESERNLRTVRDLAEAMAPCVLWIDEIEKGFAGASGSGDSGVTARVLGSFLTWMQEKTKLVFVVATANNVERIPPEMTRPGRFDGQCFVGLPDEEAVKAIFRIHAQRRLPQAVYEELLVDGIEEQIQNALGTGARMKRLPGAEVQNCVEDGILACLATERTDSRALAESLVGAFERKRGMYGHEQLKQQLKALAKRAEYSAFSADGKPCSDGSDAQF